MSQPRLVWDLPLLEAEALAWRVNRSSTARAWGFQVAAERREGLSPSARGEDYVVCLTGDVDARTMARAEGFVRGLVSGDR